MNLNTLASAAVLTVLLFQSGAAQSYPDQQYVLRIDSLVADIESNDGLMLSGDGKSLMLQQNRTDGSATLKPHYARSYFNQGLPSYNGSAVDSDGAFMIQMRFPDGAGWSPWLTVGYWKKMLWNSYGTTSYAGGYVDIDYVLMNSYVNAWQFRIVMKRTDTGRTSPTVHKLSFAVSDSRTTSSQNFAQIVADAPAAVFVPTTFIYQISVDPQIGGSICSPTSVSMILGSYGIAVNPLQFARDTYDPYHGIFGVWPRVVQNASEYGLDGAVTRYRSWTQARAVLAEGGRIAMSVSLPLYSGHLMMLAGFSANGDPIVHDPAKSNGYAYVFNKSDLSHSWFDKGGIGYTFYRPESGTASAGPSPGENAVAGSFRLHQNYPNPFNPSTMIQYELPMAGHVLLGVYDQLGREVAVLADGWKESGTHTLRWDAAGLASGVYYCRLQVRASNSPSTLTPDPGQTSASPRNTQSASGTFIQTRSMHLVR